MSTWFRISFCIRSRNTVHLKQVYIPLQMLKRRYDPQLKQMRYPVPVQFTVYPDIIKVPHLCQPLLTHVRHC